MTPKNPFSQERLSEEKSIEAASKNKSGRVLTATEKQTTRKRRCGACGGEGHNKKTCKDAKLTVVSIDELE